MAATNMPTVLEEIVRTRRTHLPAIAARIAHVNPETLALSTRSLEEALGQRGDAAFIMECKASSPSLGLIRDPYHPGEIADVYSRYARGISVLCEPDYFGGDYDHLATVRARTHLPVLCKDFIVDEVQIHAARYFGADAILLMLSVLSDEEYRRLHAEADRLGMDVLTEVINEEEVSRAIELGARIFGVNHRNLHDLSIDLSRSARLAALIPPDRVLIAESGIRDNTTVRALGGHANGFLVGSQLTGQPDIEDAARTLVFGHNKVCGLTSPTTAQAAYANGAYWGGLIFEEGSPRNVSRETSQKIIAAEPRLRYVAVSRRTIGWAQLAIAGIDALQLHYPARESVEEEIDMIQAIRGEIGTEVAIWRAVDMTKNDAAQRARTIAKHADMLVLDTGSGGTGITFDWQSIPEEVKFTSLLAGGLTCDNLTQALGAGCAGVDLNSGVENPLGAKDAGLLRSAFEIIRTYHDEDGHTNP